jgi:uncharacterized Ntn-hydrolase superfamily protein
MMLSTYAMIAVVLHVRWRKVMTFSIVAYDPQTVAWGAAVQSKFVAIGALTPWAKAGVGAIATQAWINTTYGSRGLELLAQGLSPAATIAQLTGEDQGRAHRQVGMIDARGEAATYTGEECPPWAGGLVGIHYVCQGNYLVSDAPILAMSQAFEEVHGPLWNRLQAALVAGQGAGGDTRGQQSATLLVVQAGAGFRGFNDRVIDLRVDDHPTPIVELQRILQVRLANPTWSARG